MGFCKRDRRNWHLITKPCCFVSAQGYPDIFTLALANFSLDAYFFADIDAGG